MTIQLNTEQIKEITQQIIDKLKLVDISCVSRETLYSEFKNLVKDNPLYGINSNDIDLTFYSQYLTSLVYQGCVTPLFGNYDLRNVSNPFVVAKKKTKKVVVETNVKNKLPAFVSPITESYLIPEIDTRYVKHGNYSVIESAINSGRFAPIWITGLSGNGKTYSVEQACANVSREMILINITNETNEEDLIGSFSLESIDSYEIECEEELYKEFLATL